jgi:hypothetical protein
MLVDAIFFVLSAVCWPGVVGGALIGSLFHMFGGLKLAAVGLVIGAFAGAWSAAWRDPTANSVGPETITNTIGAIAIIAIPVVAVLYWPFALAIAFVAVIASIVSLFL